MCFKRAEMLSEHGGQGPMDGVRVIEQGVGGRGEGLINQSNIL